MGGCILDFLGSSADAEQSAVYRAIYIFPAVRTSYTNHARIRDGAGTQRPGLLKEAHINHKLGWWGTPRTTKALNALETPVP